MTFAKTARSPSAGRPLQNNTRVFIRSENSVAIRLHSTDVVTYYADGSIELRTGGWKTRTTRERMDDYTPHGWGIYSFYGEWFLRVPQAWSVGASPWDGPCDDLFEMWNTMRITPNRKVLYQTDGEWRPATTLARYRLDLEEAKARRKRIRDRERARATAKRRKEKARRHAIEVEGRKAARFLARHRLVHLLATAARQVLDSDLAKLDGRTRCVVLDQTFDAQELQRLLAVG